MRYGIYLFIRVQDLFTHFERLLNNSVSLGLINIRTQVLSGIELLLLSTLERTSRCSMDALNSLVEALSEKAQWQEHSRGEILQSLEYLRRIST